MNGNNSLLLKHKMSFRCWNKTTELCQELIPLIETLDTVNYLLEPFIFLKRRLCYETAISVNGIS